MPVCGNGSEARGAHAAGTDWASYRARCDRGDVVSRWLLTQTAALLERHGSAALVERLRNALDMDPIPRPRDHRGGVDADFLEPGLDLDAVAAIAARMEVLASDPDCRLDSGRGLGGMAQAWLEYRGWLDGSHPRSPLRRASDDHCEDSGDDD